MALKDRVAESPDWLAVMTSPFPPVSDTVDDANWDNLQDEKKLIYWQAAIPEYNGSLARIPPEPDLQPLWNAFAFISSQHKETELQTYFGRTPPPVDLSKTSPSIETIVRLIIAVDSWGNIHVPTLSKEPSHEDMVKYDKAIQRKQAAFDRIYEEATYTDAIVAYLTYGKERRNIEQCPMMTR